VPFSCEGERLIVNGDAKGGAIRAQVLDEKGEPLPGFTMEECRAFTGDAVRHVMTWGKRTRLTELKGKRVRLRFELRHADLYSFAIQP
jgi:hypothetical protein